MAFNFPLSPTDGQTYTSNNITYAYNSSVGAWLLAAPQYIVGDLANAAFLQANTAYTQGNTAYTQANAAYARANTASNTAIAAFAKANTAVQNTSTVLFTGTANSANYLNGNTAQTLNNYADDAAIVYAIALG